LSVFFALLVFAPIKALSKMLVKLTISSTFYEQLLRRYSFAKKLQSQTVTREKLCESLSYEKVLRKMLVNLTPERTKSEEES